jgi:hypothetical protein
MAAEKKPWKTGASSGHIANLKQSILETFYIYGIAYISWLVNILAKNGQKLPCNCGNSFTVYTVLALCHLTHVEIA